jgi:hypothetical protein
MTETEPGRTKPDTQWGGTWTTITREDYNKAIDGAGGFGNLSVFASATRPNGDDYVYTAWGLKGADVPLVASELSGCGPEWSRVPSARCKGSSTPRSLVSSACATSSMVARERGGPAQTGNVLVSGPRPAGLRVLTARLPEPPSDTASKKGEPAS